MSDTQQMPKNVAAFVNKYGTLGSRQQDSAFWKEFRKAANAYADTQAHRVCDLERQVADLKKENKRLVADMILHKKMAMNFQIESEDSRMQERLHYDNYVSMKHQRDVLADLLRKSCAAHPVAGDWLEKSQEDLAAP